MCVIVRKPKGIKVPVETLRQCWQSNKDGAGFMYAEDGKLVFCKGLMSFKSFLRAYQKIQPKNKEVLIHFRFATHGAVANAQTHPFIVQGNIGVMHNGIINFEDESVGYVPPADEDEEDDIDGTPYQCKKCGTVQEIDTFPANCTSCKKQLWGCDVDEIVVDDTPILSDEEAKEALEDKNIEAIGVEDFCVNDESDGIILKNKPSVRQSAVMPSDLDYMNQNGNCGIVRARRTARTAGTYVTYADDVESDTQKFCSQIMEKLPPEFLNNPGVCSLLSQFLIHNYSVIACMNEKGEVKMMGDMSSQYDEKGVWFSNSFWKPSKVTYFGNNGVSGTSINAKTSAFAGGAYAKYQDDWEDTEIGGVTSKTWYRKNAGNKSYNSGNKGFNSDFHGV